MPQLPPSAEEVKKTLLQSFDARIDGEELVAALASLEVKGEEQSLNFTLPVEAIDIRVLWQALKKLAASK